MSDYVTSFRMYAAGPVVAAAWRELFGRVFAELALDIEIIEHGWPDPIDALWKRPDLFGAFMCGWPFLKAARADGGHAPQPIAVPVPSPARYSNLPRYRSEFLVLESSGWNTLKETFGHRFGWMASDSQSGFNAPRAHLSHFAAAREGVLFDTAIGPLGTPARTLDALRRGEVDVIALDSFYLDLCRVHQPEKMAGIRTVDETPWTPMPLLVAAAATPQELVQTLARRLVSLHESPEYAPLLDRVLLRRFAEPDRDSYAQLEAMAAEARERGYGTIR